MEMKLLHEKFMKCCRDIKWHAPEQKSFGNLNHLYQSIRGDLKDEVSDQELFLHLHPTPALGGLPNFRTSVCRPLASTPTWTPVILTLVKGIPPCEHGGLFRVQLRDPIANALP